MNIDTFLKDVEVLPENNNYWFVRTNGGAYFETFFKNNFIGIGWNEISLAEITLPKLEDATKRKIAKIEGIPENDPNAKKTITTIFNKLKNFKNLKKGDIIIIPNLKSQKFAFGIVADNTVYIEKKTLDCNFEKRRAIKWIKTKDLRAMDSYIYKLRVPRQAITNVNRFSDSIDSDINTLFVKNNESHFVIEVSKVGDVNLTALTDLLINTKIKIQDLNQKLGLGEDLDQISVKLNLQSPGKIEFKMPNGKVLLLYGLILTQSCNSTTKQPQTTKINQVDISLNDSSYNKLISSARELEIKIDNVNKK